jgi:hypothetical protein
MVLCRGARNESIVHVVRVTGMAASRHAVYCCIHTGGACNGLMTFARPKIEVERQRSSSIRTAGGNRHFLNNNLNYYENGGDYVA